MRATRSRPQAGAPITARAPVHRRVVRGQRIELRPGRWLDVAVHRAEGSLTGRDRSPSSLTIFLVHGAGGNKDQWRALWPSLIEQGYTLVAADLMGHGASPRPRDPASYAGSQLLADLRALVDRFGGRRNLVVGHSYGSGLSLALVDQLNACGKAHVLSAALLLGTAVFTHPHPIRDMALSRLRAMRSQLDEDFRLRAWHPHADPALVAHEMGLARRNSLAVFKALFDSPEWLEPAAIGRIPQPVLILAGDTDRITPPPGARALAELLPNAQIQIIQDCGHQLMLERPSDVLAALGHLVSQVLRAPSEHGQETAHG
jgi:pimeloyl-ACP methyl ester carboxylesterase